MNIREQLEISCVLKGEREDVAEHINKVYSEVFRVDPPPVDVVFVAEQGPNIIGTLGFDYCDDRGKMPLQSIFCFDSTKTPLPYDPRISIQFSRWTSKDPSVSLALIYATTSYALEQGMRYGWSEQKRDAVISATKAGVKLHEVKDAAINSRSIPDEVRAFYTSEPIPKLYMTDLDQMCKATKKRLSLLQTKWVICFQRERKKLINSL